MNKNKSTAEIATISFDVSDVELAEKTLSQTTHKKFMRKKFKNIEAHSKSDKYFVSNNEMVSHPFVNALHLAFSEHRPILISPDMIWLMICQGLAQHININAEDLRKQFVKHKGKIDLSVTRDEFVKGSSKNDWQGVFEELSQKIGDNCVSDIKNLIVAEFSTTTEIEKAAYEITLMESMQNYFTYSGTTMCGIPSITINGTVEDWDLIIQKSKQLKKYKLDWWINSLLPILQEFKNAVDGNINKQHWQSIYKLNSASGGPYINGWILKFFPYVKEQRNSYLNENVNSFGLTTNSFSTGLSKAKFDWNYFGSKIELDFIAGFIGISQDKISKTLTPEIGWSINKRADKNLKEQNNISLAKDILSILKLNIL